MYDKGSRRLSKKKMYDDSEVGNERKKEEITKTRD